ncbi:MAG: precorrin-6y C5,15-methyltransferase (decarboxylating) subunit CbiE [Proteobacteria bacterium]|nr:precorrin-6y C5,15-methyltransferase (decarboxylating) subunit CbiE [Pseudomonadota bacterium]
MNPVTIIGMGMTLEDLTAKHLEIIDTADILVGGKRLLNLFKESRTRKKIIGKDINGVVNFVRQEMKKQKIVILASGDPLFFGIGRRIVDAIGAKNTLIYPNISSVSAAFARIKEPWDDVSVISLHGRPNERLLFKALEENSKIAVFTDPKNNPAWLAARLLEKQVLDYKICVLEAMGSRSEKINWYTLHKAARMKFTDPNMVVLKRSPGNRKDKERLFLGAPDNWYDHHKGLITKSEIRAITLSKLRLATDHILWDLGAGSGSVAAEAALLIKKGKIFAVEKKSERVTQIKNNKKRFAIGNLKAIQAELPQGLEKLPRPDRIFIGGGGKQLKSIITAAAHYLKPRGVMVINTVLIPNVETARATLEKLDFETEVIQAQINRSRQMPWAARLEAQNPVWIVTGLRI